MIHPGSSLGRAPAHRAGDPGSDPCPGKNFFLLISSDLECYKLKHATFKLLVKHLVKIGIKG